MNDIKPKLMGGIGEINFDRQYRQGNRIYDAAAIAMCVLAQPVGNTGGYSYLYLVKNNKKQRKGENTMGITSKQTGKFRGMMRKIENEQLKIKADSVKRKKKDGKKNA